MDLNLPVAFDALMPETIARRFAASFGVAPATPPLRDRAFTWSMYRHRRHASDHGHRRLRDLIKRVRGTGRMTTGRMELR